MRRPLRRQLGLLGTVSISVGVMAPTLAMSSTGVEPARLLGRAAPLAYVFAAVGVGLVAYGFVRLAGEFASAGSVYAFAGGVLGPRAGFVCGWALLGTYLVFPAVSIAAIAVFGQFFLDSTGLAKDPSWLPIALGGWAVIGLLASRQIRTAAVSLLVVEGVALLIILALMAVIVVKLISGDAPAGQSLTADVFDVPSGTSLSTVALAATFGFLSFAGFESAGSLGEESHHPTRAIPRSLVVAIAVGAVFYVACEAVQTMGFGTGKAGTAAFASAQAPLAELGDAYVGSWMGDTLALVALVSAIGAGLGCASVGARMLFALGRDRRLPARLAGVSDTGAPAAGLAFVLGLDLVLLVVFSAAGTPAQKVFFYLATIGVLSLLVMYAITNVAAAKLIGRRWEALLPLAGILVAAYVFYRNVWPVPDSPFNLFPYVVAGWLLIGIALAVLELRLRVTPPQPGRTVGL